MYLYHYCIENFINLQNAILHIHRKILYTRLQGGGADP